MAANDPWSDSHKTLSTCEPLLRIATPEIFRQNAFRITGLPVDATTREIHKQIERLQIMEELGEGHAIHTSVFALHPPPTINEIASALHRLRDPEARVVEEFFWFWPEEFGRRENDSAMHALSAGDCDTAAKIWMVRESGPDGVAAMHNVAVFWHLTALERAHYSEHATTADLLEHGTKISWQNAVDRWRVLLKDNALWTRVKLRILQLNDPGIHVDFCERMRAAMPLALAKIHAHLAIQCAERDLMETARTHSQLLCALTSDRTAIETAADLVLASAKSRLREHAQSAKSEADLHPEQADRFAHSLIAPSLFLAEVADLFFGETENTVKDVLDHAIAACVDCVIAYQRRTGNNERFVDLLSRLRPITTDAELSARISKNLQIGKGNIEAAQKTGAARPIDVHGTSMPTKDKLVRGKARNWWERIKRSFK